MSRQTIGALVYEAIKAGLELFPPAPHPDEPDMVSCQRASKGYPKELEALLDNFDFFAINVGKLYTDAHPLSY